MASDPKARAPGLPFPQGPSSPYLRTLVPKPYPERFLGPGSLNIGYLDPLGLGIVILVF